MKTIKLFGLMLVAAFLMIGVNACGDDNDEPFGGSTGKITVNGTTFSINRAYWSAELLNETDYFYTIMLTNRDLNNIKDPWHAITIVYHTTNGTTDTFATGEFDDFEVSLTIASSDESKDRQYYAFSQENDNNNAKLVVSANGGITVSFDAMNYTDGINSTKVYSGPAFTYTGSVSKMPNINL